MHKNFNDITNLKVNESYLILKVLNPIYHANKCIFYCYRCRHDDFYGIN